MGVERRALLHGSLVAGAAVLPAAAQPAAPPVRRIAVEEGFQIPEVMTPGNYIRENVWLSTSGMNVWPQIKMCIDVLGLDRVMFAVDYPFEVSQPATDAVDRAPMPDQDRAAFYHGNAQRVFGL